MQDWVLCPLRDSTEEDQYLETLARVRRDHEAKLPAWMAASQVDFTGKPAAEWRYQTNDLMLGRS